jgi:hypothetical protein
LVRKKAKRAFEEKRDMEARGDQKERKELQNKLMEAQTAVFWAMANKMGGKKTVVESNLD